MNCSELFDNNSNVYYLASSKGYRVRSCCSCFNSRIIWRFSCSRSQWPCKKSVNVQRKKQTYPTTHVMRKSNERPSVDFSRKFVRICGTSAMPQLITLIKPCARENRSRVLHTQSSRYTCTHLKHGLSAGHCGIGTKNPSISTPRASDDAEEWTTNYKGLK